jgi:hypothetical protein
MITRYQVILTALVLLAAPLRADVVTFGAANDSTLFETPDGSLAGGQGEYFFVGKTLINQIRRTVIRFDIAANVPTGAIIDSASLTLHMSRTPTTGTEVAFHRLNQAWVEGSTNPPGEEGAGGLTEPGDVTWIHTSSPGGFWTNPGGDFSPLASATTMVFGVDFYSWDLTADAQAMLDAPSLNFGWAVLGEEGSDTTAKRFESRESPELAFRPSMTINYHLVPSPSILAVSALSLLGLGCRLRRSTSQ